MTVIGLNARSSRGELDDVGRPALLQRRDEHVDLRFRHDSLDRVGVVPNSLETVGDFMDGKQADHAVEIGLPRRST